MHEIITIHGNAFLTSRSGAILKYAEELIVKHGLETASITVRDLPPEDLIYSNFESPKLKELQFLIKEAKAVIISTPVYNSSYTGALKALLDLMPQYAFAGKTILPIATGGSINHLLSIDYAMKPLFSTMGATHILRGVYVVSSQIQFDEQGHIQLDTEIEERLQISIQELINTVKQKQLVSA
ncbi:NADPH-dependent FMN reductase [Scytonema sp. NUACC26]|uniref:NADPH-dependent FMN reductase n=1 Tax=Scytonema sp. NUACC26 TaxID=3140176 RepID=UPI0034DC927C